MTIFLSSLGYAVLVLIVGAIIAAFLTAVIK